MFIQIGGRKIVLKIFQQQQKNITTRYTFLNSSALQPEKLWKNKFLLVKYRKYVYFMNFAVLNLIIYFLYYIKGKKFTQTLRDFFSYLYV